jgi:hypothetical protein
MNLSFVIEQANAAWSRVEAFLAAWPQVAAAGLIAAVVAAVVLAFMLIMWAARLFMSLRRSAIASRIRRTRDGGVRIVVARARSGRRASISRFLERSLETHLAAFMFGGPFTVVRYPGGLPDEAAARRLLARSEADLIVWSDLTPGTKGEALILSRPANFESVRSVARFALPKERSAWNPALSRAMAYAAARQFRPALGRPQDFRAERLQPVVEELLAILAEKPKADPRLLADMVDDAAAGALQLAYAGDETWLERAVEIAGVTLNELNRSASPDRWIAAKINMGRSLRLKAERRFDPVVLRESIAHLTEALDALRSEPRFKLAESAAQGIGEAQRMLGARKKFSISNGGI